ncbi:T9SS C-terminal target domain-containing protein [Chryseobacterium nematophagum]|uniref:T9SS C-terminal target domain-containing protein n=1 Tax=Chryseobacterium nematophagum TaxID=2305228 RepID=A0A3M7L9E5_9FLAO|nr:zinc-dependent metalloprotease family protein [Chryseobacterium nematophagum]RMZ58076.1 T9SS C-terminal target domain-containing protein [Chryseobacterium nematophagum]
MKKILTTLMLVSVGGALFGQWTPTSARSHQKQKSVDITDLSNIKKEYYKLDLNVLKSQLRSAHEMGADAKPIIISIPTLNGKIERFNVYSFPVVVKELAEQYELGSYIGTGIDDPTKTLRFSISPKGFNSMIFTEGGYEFIDPQINDNTVYEVHPKTKNTGGKSFVCSTEEASSGIKDIETLLENGKSFTNQPNDFTSKMSDKKYRTMRLAMSVTGEYTAFHGGTVNGALAAINTTLTRVNGVFEKDFALHLNLQNFPGIIYTNPNADPYSDADAMDNWNVELQQTLTANVTNGNYDIGHLFGASGGGGNAGCIGCVCINPATNTSTQKGSGYTSPANGIPQGDSFDIDYVAHEMGHQLGANHTFSHGLENASVNVEPGSGSTIMGYAGITGSNTDVQPHSDAYFHNVSIKQVQANLNNKTCDVETTMVNNPPLINALPTYNIPKGTAFVLTASATDAEGDPMTYSWEEVDNAGIPINKTNLGTTTTGATFRSMMPTSSPTRYFPKLSSVLDGVLDNANNGWESVSKVARTTKFAVTVRDNNPNVAQQETQYAEQTIVVGNDGPFRINTNLQYVYSNQATPIEWDVANTTAFPYSVSNVKIDYTSDNGATWVVLSASTPNDGSESFTFPTSLNNQIIKVRISSIGNVFYAAKSVVVANYVTCASGGAASAVLVNNITTFTANVTWAPVSGTTSYIIRYKKTSETTWQQTTSATNSVALSNLADATAYEVQVAAVCSGTPGGYSTSSNFTTVGLTYCAATSTSANPAYEYISNVTLANVNNNSGQTNYGNYTTNSTLQINMIKGNSYPLSVTVGNPDYDAVIGYIDFNRNGTFESSEKVLDFPVDLPTGPITSTVTVPSTAVENKPLRMRIILVYGGPNAIGVSPTGTCGSLTYGEIEDYNVVVASTLSTSESTTKNSGIQIYPNPVSDILNVTKVSDKAAYRIYNAAGQLVIHGAVINGQINVSGLIKGGYVITIEDYEKDVFNSKFIKK